MLRLSLSVLLIFSMMLSQVSLLADPPTDAQIKKLYNEQPYRVNNMVRKLYVLEHATPKFVWPESILIFKENGDVVVDFTKPGSLLIGNTDYNLSYEFYVKPTLIVGDRIPETTAISPAWYVAGGLLLMFAGFAGGVYVSGAL